jgi:hypothetical protein
MLNLPWCVLVVLVISCYCCIGPSEGFFFQSFFFTGSVQREETLHGIGGIGMQFWA